MKNILFVFLAIFISIGNIQAQKRSFITKEDLKKEFAVFKNSLLETEAQLYRYVSEDSLTTLLDNCEDSILNHSVDLYDIFRHYSYVLDKFNTGHTEIVPSKDVIGSWASRKKSLPFDIVISGGKMHCYESFKNVTKEAFEKLPKKEKAKHEITEYAEIVSIDGMDINEWMDKIALYVSTDDNKVHHVFEKVKISFEFYRNLVSKDKGISTVRYTSGKDTLSMDLDLGLPPMKTLSERIKLMQSEQKKIEKDIGTFEVIGSKIGHLKFPSFANAEGKKYERFLDKTFATIHQKKLSKLVVDVRGNSGGYIQMYLLQYFLKPQKQVLTYTIEKQKKPSTFKYLVKNKEYRFNQKNLKKIKRQLKKNPSLTESDLNRGYPARCEEEDHRFLGDIVVVTDKSSFSAATTLVSVLQYFRGAKIVGVEAGGSYQTNTAGTYSFKLPVTKMILVSNPNLCEIYRPKANESELRKPDVYFQEVYGNPKLVDKKNEENFLKALKKAFSLFL